MKQVVDPTQFSRIASDLTYADRSPSQKLDIVYPEAGEGPFPLVVFFHGGGFVGGAKNDFTIAFVFKLIARGYAVASVEYRLGLEAAWPAQIHDVKAAIRYLRANAERLNLKTNRIAVAGNSAGGALAQLVAATGGKPVLEDLSMGYGEYSSKVDVLISWYGLNDFVQEALRDGMSAELFCQVNMISPEDLARVWHEEPVRVTDILLRKKGYEALEEVQAMNPKMYINQDFPYALFQHGMADPVVPYTQSEDMVNAIRLVCGPDRAELDLVPEASHGSPVFKSNENMERCLAFLQKHIPCPEGFYGPLPEIRTVVLEETVK